MTTKSKEERYADSMAAPFVAAFAAGRLEKQSMGNVAEGNRFDSRPAPVPTPDSFHPSGSPVFSDQSSNYPVADKTFSKIYGTVKVSFYQHYKLRIIRAVARKNGVVKQLIFTPEIASERSVVYDMTSAMEWVRQIGFKHVRPIDPNTYLAPAATALPPAPMPSQRASPPPQQHAPASPAAPAPEPAVRAAPVNRTKSVPPQRGAPLKPSSEGKIMFLGEVEKPGRDGKPNYTIYAIAIREEFSRYNTEFIGVHLAELATQQRLQVGMSIRIQPLGKRPTNFLENGVWKETFRNEFSITVL